METTEVKSAVDELGQTFELFKQKNDERLAEIEKKGVADPLLENQVSKINKEVGELDETLKAVREEKEAEKERLDEIEKRLNRPGVGSDFSAEANEHKDAFIKWMRTLEKGNLKDLEQKAVTIGTASAGGHAVPEEISRNISQKLLDISDLRKEVNVVTAATSDYKVLVDVLGTASGWAGETTTRSETATSTLEEVAPTFGELYAVPKASEWSLDDVFFDVEGWLADSVANEFAYQEGEAIVTGNGTNKPTGFLDGTPVTTDDDSRAFGVLQYIASGAAADISTYCS